MHVISCRVQDELRIGETVSIVVLEVADDHIRLGITSPHQEPEYQEQVVFLAGEAEPGLALGILPLQDTRIPVIIKPGAFGDAGCLVRSLERLRVIHHGSPA